MKPVSVALVCVVLQHLVPGSKLGLTVMLPQIHVNVLRRSQHVLDQMLIHAIQVESVVVEAPAVLVLEQHQFVRMAYAVGVILSLK